MVAGAAAAAGAGSAARAQGAMASDSIANVRQSRIDTRRFGMARSLPRGHFLWWCPRLMETPGALTPTLSRREREFRRKTGPLSLRERVGVRENRASRCPPRVVPSHRETTDRRWCPRLLETPGTLTPTLSRREREFRKTGPLSLR